jgi:hypothetical protein
MFWVDEQAIAIMTPLEVVLTQKSVEGKLEAVDLT